MKNTFLYQIGDNLYINLTNRCTNSCEFCIRIGREGTDGYELWLDREPTAAEIIAELTDISPYKEIVFCGFGEPIIKLDEVVQIGRHVKALGGTVRINTNGQGNLIHGRNIVPELIGAVDIISISMNAPNAKRYDEVCHSEYGLLAFPAVMEFAKICHDFEFRVILSIVDTIPKEDIETCRKVCAHTGAEFRVRTYY